MKKVKKKTVVAKNNKELMSLLGLTPADGMEIEFRSELNSKIIEIVSKKNLTHAQVAVLAATSRTRVTAIMNRHTHEISTDLMLRILGALGCSAKVIFKEAA